MKARVTVKVKIPKRKEIIEFFDFYKKACQFCADTCFKHKIRHKYALHKLVYQDIRERFNLKAQFAINAIAQGFGAYNSCKKKVLFKSIPIRYDKRTFSFFNDHVRITTNDKRIDIPISIAEYYAKYLSWSYQTMDIFLDRKNRMFANITFSKDININDKVTRVVGVDVGVNNLAVSSDGQVFKGHKTKIMQYRYMRRRLQAKGTKSARRKLKRISGRQKRYMAWVNHNVSKRIVSSGDTFVLENLKGIRKSRNKFMGKRLNRWLNSWSFYQLQNFIRYKAEFVGKKIIFVNPYMTSQTCSNCGKLGSRYFDFFSCSHCGFSSQSDFNASCNLRRLNITQPNVSADDTKGHPTTEVNVRDKYPRL